ncbi:MAG: carbohydrate-binding protein [Phycisphaerales bacterium]
MNHANRLAVGSLMLCAGVACGQVHYTYLWHMEQPVYWPDQATSGPDRYEVAWQSIQRTDGGAAHPENNLRDIFGLADRQAGYQYRMRDAINDIRWTAEGGAQISYSGGLIRNIQSLGEANQLGYGTNWNSWLREARGWNVGGVATQPRADIVLFGFHHPLMPLIDDTALRKELQLYKEVYGDAWGTAVPRSRGLFPSEMAFSTRMIEVLSQEGVQWAIVSAEKMSRACSDFPVVYGSGGVNTDPPNRADQVNPAQGASSYFRRSISRGCAPAEAVPFAFVPRRARHVNPMTGAISSIIVVPACQSLSWEDGYAPLGTGALGTLNSMAPNGLGANRPMLVMLAHDGDNAWGGGFSYYREAVPNFASNATSQGYIATTVEKYLADHPVPATDYVHVEDGAWVNADGDFGAPSFLNWNWPLVNASGQVDIEGGWAEDARNWAVITAANNRVATAEQIATRPGGPQPTGLNTRRILYPDAATTFAERAWHYFLGSLNSGYMYYGTAVDMEVKPTIACNEAIEHASTVIGTGTLDQTGPTIWALQRWPWNPGSTNFGPAHGYQQRSNNGDFYIWTFIDDVSGMSNVTLKYRIDNDGQRSLANIENETYAGGSGVGAWQSLPMTMRDFPAGNFFNNPSINFFEMPTVIADQYWVKLNNIRSSLLDYYVEATDTRGNVTRSPISHVWVGDGGGGSPTGPTVSISPTTPIAGQAVTVTYDSAGRPLAGASNVCMHWGVNNWQQVPADPAMSATVPAGRWQTTITLPSNATQLDVVFNNCAGTWDNNGGADWHFAVQGGAPTPQWTMDGVRDAASVQVASNNSQTMRLWAGLIGDALYVATNDAGEGNDHFIFVANDPAGAMVNAPWAKSGQVAGSLAFLADENNNDFEGWFDQGSGVAVQAMTGANGGVLEGTINLRQELGLAANAPLPEYITLAVGAYATADGGALVSSSQAPPAVSVNGNIEATEFARVRLCELTNPTSCPPVGPVCDAIDFNNDTSVFDPIDIDAFLSVYGEGPCVPPGATCSDIDFNNDGSVFDPCDIDAFLLVFSEGPCTNCGV